MKKIMLFLLITCVGFTSLQAQKNFRKKNDKKIKWGVKVGMNTSDVDPSDLLIANNDDFQKFRLNVQDAKYGLHLGAFMHIKSGKRFFIRPELLLNTTRVDYNITDLASAQPISKIVTESYTNIKVPINLGLKFGPIRLQGGAVTAANLANKSGLEQYEGYEADFAKIAMGWQAAIGIDIWKFNFDIKYEGDFGKYADHMNFFGESVAFNDREKQMKFAVGWAF